MALTQTQKRKLVADALRDHLPWDGVDDQGEPTPDARTLRDLRLAFEARHLMGLVKSYRKAQAETALEDFDIADI